MGYADGCCYYGNYAHHRPFLLYPKNLSSRDKLDWHKGLKFLENEDQQEG